MRSEDSLKTRRTLVGKLRNLDDQESWRVFFDRYWELFYNVARQSGLTEEEAQDVVQETVIAVARAMPGFRYDPARGSFKQWLLRITRRRITDHLRKLYRQPARVELNSEAIQETDEQAACVIDPGSGWLDAAWEEEWERRVLAEGIERVKRTASPKQFQIFDYCVLKEWPASKVAATLGLNAAQVYLAKHRVSQLVKQSARLVRDEWSAAEGLG